MLHIHGLDQRLDLERGQRWFAARVLPHREVNAQLNLSRQGFRSYAPRVRRTIRHARKLRNVLAPLFPGYIFLILNLSTDRWRSVNGTIGVASLIMGGRAADAGAAGALSRRWWRQPKALERFGSTPTLRLARRFAFCLGHSPKPFVDSCISTTEGVFACSSNSWARKSLPA